MLSRGRVGTVATEVSQRWLKPQGCSSEELLVLLSRAGFKVDLRADAPSCMFDMGYGCETSWLTGLEMQRRRAYGITVRWLMGVTSAFELWSKKWGRGRENVRSIDLFY